MGVMEKMRKSTGIILWVLIFSFGILWALADTKVFDAMQAGPNNLGEVNGEPISLEEYNNRVSYYIDQYSQQTGNSITPEMRAYYEDQAWEELVTSKLIQQKMDDLGIEVTDQEVVEMIRGENPDPFIRQQFQREDGTIDRVALQAAIEAPENSQAWIMVEQQLRQKRRQQKMTNYVQSSMEVSRYEVEQAFIKRNTFADVSYVRFPYAEIPDSAVEVTESDLRSYYNENEENYQREESYRFKYVSFDKTPTKEDTTRIVEEMKGLRSDFATTDNDSLFLVRYQSATPYSAEFVEKSEISEKYKPVLELDEGEVSEAIKKDGQVFTIKKLEERGDEVKFVVFTFDIRADPIATVDKKAEEADDFSFFAEEDGFEEEAERREFELKEAFATKGNSFIAGLGQSRQIMNFLETASEGAISSPIELSNQFVVLKVSEITPAGTRPFEEVQSQIRTVVINNKRKEQIENRINSLLASNETLQAIASASGKEIATAENLSMNSSVIPGAGREPKVVGAVFGLEESAISAPIAGSNAVFVAQLSNRTNADPATMTPTARRQLEQQLQQQKSSAFSQVWMEQLKEAADIEDYRATLLRGG